MKNLTANQLDQLLELIEETGAVPTFSVAVVEEEELSGEPQTEDIMQEVIDVVESYCGDFYACLAAEFVEDNWTEIYQDIIGEELLDDEEGFRFMCQGLAEEIEELY